MCAFELCPRCDGLMSWSMYFQAYQCSNCSYDSRFDDDEPSRI